MLQIATAAAEEAIEQVLGSPQPKTAGDTDDSDGEHQALSEKQSSPPQSSPSDAAAAKWARKVSVCEHEVSLVTDLSTLSKSATETNDNPNHALGAMATSILNDKGIYSDIYDLMGENVALWERISDGIKERGSMDGLAMYSQAYACVEISNARESTLIRVVPRTINFRIVSLDRRIPKKFIGFVFAQETTVDGYILKYGISASIYADLTPSNRHQLLEDFRSHLQRMNKCIAKACRHHKEADEWNEYVSGVVLEWMGRFPKSEKSSNCFIRKNIEVEDVFDLQRLLDTRKPAVVQNVVSYEKIG